MARRNHDRGPGTLAGAALTFSLVLGFAAAPLGSAGAPAAAEEASADAPRRAREFTYPDVNPASSTHGRRLALRELYAERGIVLNFLASWCAHCWQELPELQRIADDGTAEIVGIAADEYGPPDDLVRLIGQARLTIPVLLVPRDEIATLERDYDHATLPATYVIDREGAIRRVFQGVAPHEELLREIDSALGR